MVYLIEVASVGEQDNFGGVAEARVLRLGVGQADDAGCDLNGHCPREVVQSEDRVALLAANDDLHRRATFVLEHDRLRQGRAGFIPHGCRAWRVCEEIGRHLEHEAEGGVAVCLVSASGDASAAKKWIANARRATTIMTPID